MSVGTEQRGSRGGATAETRAPRWARAYVAALLVAIVVCGLARIEAWPLTGWRLFSALRDARQASWEVVGVDEAGIESPVPFWRLGAAYAGFTHLLRDFPGLSVAEQARVCDAWLEAAARAGEPAVSMRLYVVERDVSSRVGDRGAPPDIRRLRYTCAGGAVERSA